MDARWIILAVIVLAVLGIVYVVLRRSRRTVPLDAGSPAASRDFSGERETSRLGGMSEEDRAWQAASLEKDRTNREQKPPTP
jgi:hypothetical protein